MHHPRPETAPRPAAPRQFGWGPRLLLLAITFGLMVPFLEVAVRLVAPQPPSWLEIFREHPELPFYSNQPDAQAAMDTGDQRWSVRTDSNGFRIGEHAPNDDGRPLLLWLGDSFTFGYGVDYDATWVNLLERDARFPYRVMNAAVSGYGPREHRLTLEHLLGRGLRPAAVFVGAFLGNDHVDMLENKQIPVRDGILGNSGGLRSFLKRNSHLYRIAAASYHRLHPGGVYEQAGLNADHVAAWKDGPLRGAAETLRKEYESIASLCRSRGIDLRVVVIPHPTLVEAAGRGELRNEAGTIDRSLAHHSTLTMLAELGISHVDLLPVMKQHSVAETYYFFDGHFTPKGHLLARDAIARAWPHLLEPVAQNRAP